MPSRREFIVEPLRNYFLAGDRVEYRSPYFRANRDLNGVRGTVVEPAPMSLFTGVRILWDTGEERVVSCLEARKLTLLESLSEV